MPQPPKNLSTFDALVEIVTELRGPNGCPWDKEQTHASLRRYIIEEAYEVIDAIDAGQQDDLQEELGDLLFQVVLHSELGRQSGDFSIEDVIKGISEKMVRRHPHVFGDSQVSSTAEVLSHWETLKAKEKKNSFGFNIPNHLPALIASQKIGEKTKKYNFDWESPHFVVEKIEEELNELKAAIRHLSSHEIKHEIGDLLFSVVQLARHLDIEAEGTLREANQRFEKRFVHMQKSSSQRPLGELHKDELEQLWMNAKKALSEEENGPN